ncbi:hypothetical protein ACIRP3_43510 [Streptomyces sp. NPDC101209]|uniref:hypothetical protein n=1 Tax=Streptomyces sp. NPDC101209 TaxID=3366129 RepID=UPI0037FDACD4
MATVEPNPALLPFKEITEPCYASRFVDRGLTQEELPGDGVLLHGLCPRCDAPVQAFLPASTVRSVVPPPAPPIDGSAPPAPGSVAVTADGGAGSPGVLAADTAPLVCNCTACDHPSRPAEYPDGCGAYWLITVEQEET